MEVLIFIRHQLFLLNLSLKNLKRYVRRTAITVSAIAFGISLFLYVDSMFIGADRDSERNLIEYETGLAQILDPEYWEHKEELPLGYAVDKSETIIHLLKKERISYAPRIKSGAEVIYYKDPFPNDGNQYVIIEGIDYERDNQIYGFKESIVKGNYLTGKSSEAVIGSWLADDIGADIGYPIVLYTHTRDGIPQTIDVIVSGIFKSPNPNINRSTILINLEDANYYLDMESSLTSITIDRLDPGEDINKLISQFGYTILTWKELGRDFISLSQAKKGGSKIYLFLVFIIAALGISNTMLMAVYERKKEIGMLQAIGFSHGSLIALFIYESAFIGLMGFIMGFILFIPLNIQLTTVGLDFTNMFRQADMGYRSVIFKGIWNITTIIISGLSGIFMSICFAILPALKSIHSNIALSVKD
ncbi:ABC transporter permease [Spirochaeta cellobiosiphila]|uniref:ABC transporter permease n=1 Tax=Spirochaeta cellobiosiphila TaxID=504483 RepID=UPI000416A6F2|nr:FtsX-like permease family protein [Spirochaeta cellobiosiphila]